MNEIVINNLVPEDQDIIQEIIESKLEGFDYVLKKRGTVFKIKVEDRNLDGAKRSGLTRRLKNLEKRSYSVNFYDNEKLTIKHKGAASGADWMENIPKLKNGLTNFMWNHEAVKFPEALKIATTPKPGINALDISLGHKASGITVYQFDTGYTFHPAIHGYKGYFSQDKSSSGGQSVSAILKVKSSMDNERSYVLSKDSFQKPCHGTATAFTMIGQKGEPEEKWGEGPKSLPHLTTAFTNNLSGGLYPFVNFVPVLLSRTVSLSGRVIRSLKKPLGNAININRAINAAINNAHVITMSMGGQGFPPSVRASIK